MVDDAPPPVPPGWYPDPQAPGAERWWSGTGWTRYTQPATARPVPPPAVQHAPAAQPAAATQQMAVAGAPRARRRFGVGEVVAVVVVVVGGLLGLPLGVGGVIVMLALDAIVVGAYALTRGRSRMWRIRSRPMAALVLGLAVVLLFVGGGIGSAMHPVESDLTGAASQVAPSTNATPAAATTTSAAPAPTKTPTPSSSASVAVKPQAGSALALLATLKVKGKSPLTGYARVADFGPSWFDVDGNGCDTRDDILSRDLTGTTTDGCKVETGTLADPYTGTTIDFQRGETTSMAVQIDHVVALADAWQTGAQKLTYAQRVDLADDPIELLAVDGPTNESKGDGDAATWLPSHKASRCMYVAHQVSVKAAYHLWVTPAEHAAMERVLDTCPTQPAFASVTAALRPDVPVEHTAAPKKSSSGSGSSSGSSGSSASSGGSSTSGGSSSGGSGSGAPAGATARCNDGSYSYAVHHQGACSHHGGVAEWL